MSDTSSVVTDVDTGSRSSSSSEGDFHIQYRDPRPENPAGAVVNVGGRATIPVFRYGLAQGNPGVQIMSVGNIVANLVNNHEELAQTIFDNPGVVVAPDFVPDLRISWPGGWIGYHDESGALIHQPWDMEICQLKAILSRINVHVNPEA